MLVSSVGSQAIFPFSWAVSPQTQTYLLPNPLDLESGGRLHSVRVAYRSWGQLNAAGDNAVVVCHALTGSADVDDWWASLLGAGRSLDPQQDFILCCNILGSCYGSTGPTDLNPATGRPYGPDFPVITVRDMIRAQAALLQSLGVRSIKLVIGGSLGGMQTLEWAALYPQWVQRLVVIAAPGRHSAWSIGFSEAQRQAIYADPLWHNGYYSPHKPPRQGVAIARMIAMTTYRSWQSFGQRFGRQQQHNGRKGEAQFAIASYLKHQGEKLVKRFDANTYITLTQAMDRHDLGCDRSGGYEQTLANIFHPTLVVSIDSDVLYPPAEQAELSRLMPNAQLVTLQSPHGHDAFLIDMAQLNQLVLNFS